MRKLLLACTLAVAAGAAHADDIDDSLGVYVGAGVVKSKMEQTWGTNFDFSNTSWKVFAGIHTPGMPLGIDIDYVDLGSQDAGTFEGPASASAKAFGAYLVGYLPIPVKTIDVYGKAGLARWQFNGSLPDQGFFSVSDNGTDFAWGVGAQVHFMKSLAVRLEYEHFNVREANDVQLYSLGLSYQIL
jgi:OmpA-OmpF porin, OOP family